MPRRMSLDDGAAAHSKSAALASTARLWPPGAKRGSAGSVLRSIIVGTSPCGLRPLHARCPKPAHLVHWRGLVKGVSPFFNEGLGVRHEEALEGLPWRCCSVDEGLLNAELAQQRSHTRAGPASFVANSLACLCAAVVVTFWQLWGHETTDEGGAPPVALVVSLRYASRTVIDLPRPGEPEIYMAAPFAAAKHCCTNPMIDCSWASLQRSRLGTDESESSVLNDFRTLSHSASRSRIASCCSSWRETAGLPRSLGLLDVRVLDGLRVGELRMIVVCAGVVVLATVVDELPGDRQRTGEVSRGGAGSGAQAGQSHSFLGCGAPLTVAEENVVAGLVVSPRADLARHVGLAYKVVGDPPDPVRRRGLLCERACCGCLGPDRQGIELMLRSRLGGVGLLALGDGGEFARWRDRGGARLAAPCTEAERLKGSLILSDVARALGLVSTLPSGRLPRLSWSLS
eukprot:scaffold142085_cov29-Tisochrysis_lutea.AAC.1